MPVRFEPMSPEERELVELSAVDDVVNVDMAHHITAVAARVAEHGSTMTADADAPASLIGREPVTFREYARSL